MDAPVSSKARCCVPQIMIFVNGREFVLELFISLTLIAFIQISLFPGMTVVVVVASLTHLNSRILQSFLPIDSDLAVGFYCRQG